MPRFAQQPQIDVMEGFKPPPRPAASFSSSFSSAFHEPDPAGVLLQLCNGLINERENATNPLRFAGELICSLLDNVNLDLCAIVPRYDREHEEATHKISCLLGFDSPTFKLIFSDEKLFDSFLEFFAGHAELSPVPLQTAGASLYVWLLKQYLNQLLPLNDDDFALIRTRHGNKQQSSAATPIKKRIRTPFRLLRDDIFTQTADSFDTSFDFGSTYVRLLQFVELLFTNYAVVSMKPVPAQLVSLKAVVIQYVDFLLAGTNDLELEKFKSRLRSNRQFARTMYAFFKEQLSNLPLDQTFVCCFDIFIPLLYPGDGVYKEAEKLQMFKRFATENFVRLLPIVVDRICQSDIRALIQLDILQYFLVRLMNPNFLKMLCDLRISAVDFLRPVQARLKAVVDAQKQSDTLANRWSNFFMLDSHEERTATTYLTIVNDRIRDFYATYPPSEVADRPLEDASVCETLNVSNGTINSTLSRKPRSTIPDHMVDAWTSMYYLTPTGRDQVAHRLAKFDFARYSKEIAEAEGCGRWENKWLAAKLSEIAARWSRHPFVRYLRQNSANPMIRPLTSVLLQPKSPPAHVPVYCRTVSRRPATLNLRLFASYPVLALLLFFSWVLLGSFFG